ncbi:MAG: ABC-type transport auxiliary lipoprotein family protein [Campylobacterota bacterium]|nr:ABC-type transport auxiliary lipoprotein family protein [Campylobacterota bacterium]
MKFSFFIVVLVLLISGCSTTNPSITEYRINTNLEQNDSKLNSCLDKSLKVAEAFSSSSLMSLDMNYATGDNKQFTYTQSQWSLSPHHAITSEMLNLLRDTNLFKTVQISKSRTRNDMILETSIDDFMQYFQEGENRSFANVRISLTLVDAKSSKAIATKTFGSRVNCDTLDAEGGVIALNSALEDVLTQSSVWLKEVCR